MRYISTRGRAKASGFEEALLAGLAEDGGLYVPEHDPAPFDAEQMRRLRGRDYAEVAAAILARFAGDAIDRDRLAAITGESYAAFTHRAVAPLVQIGANEWLLELFHGPTLAFKDFALQVLGRLYDHLLEKRNTRVTIIGATSGDTGSAAIEAIRGRKRASIVILHPAGKVSEVQRLQMTTVHAPNVHNIAIDGTFDDCQALVKAMFNDAAFRKEMRLSGVNSINWARIVLQVVYYFTAALSLGAPDRRVSFSVPSGNFGNVFAGLVALRMGLPISRLVVASNENDILTRVFCTGEHRLAEVCPTISPSMDIQISSNFERLLFDLHGRSGERVRASMRELAEKGGFGLDAQAMASISPPFVAGRCDDARTLSTIASVFAETGIVIDPHSAVGVAVARQTKQDDEAGTPMISLATAHPAKFPDAVEKAIGIRPPLPARLADLHRRPERCTNLANDLDPLMRHIRACIKAEGDR
ncbi:MAG: threonine synthase [Ectothiorhodospiraceae bacterium AqS1]|nr:threonine synthase [Ectothiorhodospiraceae bacterium AqS1]